MTNNEIIEKAKEEMKLRVLAKRTEEDYLKILTIFMRYYKNEPIYEMSEVEIREFLLYHIEEKRSASSTVNTYNSHIKIISQYHITFKYIYNHPT